MGVEVMTKSMKLSKNGLGRSVLVRVCPEFGELIKDVQQKTYAVSTPQATKIIFDQMIFDTNMAGIFQRKKI
jgi:hypothetical protein